VTEDIRPVRRRYGIVVGLEFGLLGAGAAGRDRRDERARLPDGEQRDVQRGSATTEADYERLRQLLIASFEELDERLAGPRPSFVNDAPWRIDVEPAPADWDAPHHREVLAT
jgi:hypothetical protein